MLLCLLITVVSAAVQATDLDYQSRTVTVAMSQEPPDMNAITSTDAVSGMLLGHVMEGLLRYDPNGDLVGGVAQRWQLRDDGATFWLRPDAKWSDGSPVTAQDFVFSWQQAVTPAVASEYASILFPVQNAQAINDGQMAPSTLGVRALDDHTLEVSLHQPCPYFLGLTAFRTLFPVKESFYRSRGSRYAAEARDMLYNGPFALTRWVHGASVRMEKNPHYWGREHVWLNRIDVPYITEDPNAHMNLYRDHKIAMASSLNSESLEGALRERMQIKSYLDGAIFYIEFNHRDARVTRNRNLRKAIQQVFNTDDLVYKVMGSPGSFPTYTLFPRWLKGKQDFFVREYPAQKPELNVTKARAYLDKAKQELGVAKIPPISLLADDSPGGQKTAEYLQTLLGQSLGLEIRVDMQIFKQRLAKTGSGDFDMVVSGWGPDYEDLLTYGDLFASHNLNNRGRYRNERYDHWVAVAQSSLDVAERMHAFDQMQKILFADAVIVPLYERGNVYVQNPRLQGVLRRALGGDPNFNYASIQPEVSVNAETSVNPESRLNPKTRIAPGSGLTPNAHRGAGVILEKEP
ncbi:peptide ABC transporter substrate-binding protein [Pseudomaricurvus hydrocarbonicus]